MAMAEAKGERTVYEAGGGRKFFLALAFLILLPFYASLPAMLIQRLIHGLWFDTIGLMIFTLLFTALMALLGVQLYQAIRSRVEFGDTAVRITLPQGSGATPMLRFVNREIPYGQIGAVETRCVLFGNAFAPVLLRATRVLTKDGQHVRLGNVNEDNVDQALPFPEIGHKLAQRAGCEVADGGMVRRSIERRVLGFLGRKTAIEESSVADGRGEGRDQDPAQPRHALPDDRDGRADRGRHCRRRPHGPAHVVCHGRRVLGTGQQEIASWRTR